MVDDMYKYDIDIQTELRYRAGNILMIAIFFSALLYLFRILSGFPERNIGYRAVVRKRNALLNDPLPNINHL